jgi:hypothetical protein
MKIRRILKTTPFFRFLLAMVPLLLVDLILAPISLAKGNPSLGVVVLVNLLAISILALRFALLFFKRRICRACGKTQAVDTGDDEGGYPLVECRRCGRRWIL